HALAAAAATEGALRVGLHREHAQPAEPKGQFLLAAKTLHPGCPDPSGSASSGGLTILSPLAFPRLVVAFSMRGIPSDPWHPCEPWLWGYQRGLPLIHFVNANLRIP